ncbi:hypothetical protein [Crateriforma conspicua]|uniref:hypothetical protein n=1 Tax=Crateriforma conspicua TaxID=2527996 RepID=UPI0011B62FF6|nr:hypothetical protein [Crateriforma conspicua]
MTLKSDHHSEKDQSHKRQQQDHRKNVVSNKNGASENKGHAPSLCQTTEPALQRQQQRPPLGSRSVSRLSHGLEPSSPLSSVNRSFRFE